MNDYISNLILQALDNEYFRNVLETGNAMQIVIMSLKPGEDIGAEVHEHVEQALICLSGSGKSVVDGEEHEYVSGDLVLVRAGREHNFINTGSKDMKILTIYSPPNHAEGTVHKTKAEAETKE